MRGVALPLALVAVFVGCGGTDADEIEATIRAEAGGDHTRVLEVECGEVEGSGTCTARIQDSGRLNAVQRLVIDYDEEGNVIRWRSAGFE